MATDLEISDREEIFRAVREKRRADPEVVRRVQARAQVIRDDLRKRAIGNVAVSLIREVRDE
jgi:hypothetical protein